MMPFIERAFNLPTSNLFITTAYLTIYVHSVGWSV